MRETFSSVPTARDASLSFSSLPSLFLSFSRRYTRACAHAYACSCVCVDTPRVCCTHAVCPSTESSSVTEWGGEGDGGHRRRWTARDAARRESLKEIETARPLCLLVYD